MLPRLQPAQCLHADGSTIPAYEILRHLGTGGAGRVYLAKEIATGESVVIKTPRTWQFVEDLFQEARHVLPVSLPHVARIRQLQTTLLRGTPYDVPFLVLDAYIGSLHQRLRQAKAVEPNLALRWIDELARGLQASQLIHRDLKPENILLDSADHAWICDFGLAIPANPLVRDRQSMAIEGVVGTALYMSPEQIYEAANIDIRSDIYALGLLLFEMLTGTSAQPRHPSRMSEENYLTMLLDFEVQWQEIPSPPLAELVRICTAKARRDRFPDYWSLLDAVADLQDRFTSAMPPTSASGAV